jgi:hypothetical protein
MGIVFLFSSQSLERPKAFSGRNHLNSIWPTQGLRLNHAAQACELLRLNSGNLLDDQSALNETTCNLAQQVLEIEDQLQPASAERFVVSRTSKKYPYSAWRDLESLLPEYLASKGQPLVLWLRGGLYSETGFETIACNVRSVKRLAQLLSSSPKRRTTVVIERSNEGLRPPQLEMVEQIFACAGIEAQLRTVSMSQHLYDAGHQDSTMHAYYNGFWTLGRQAASNHSKERPGGMMTGPSSYRLLALGGSPRPHKVAFFYNMYDVLTKESWAKIKWSIGHLPAPKWTKPITFYHPRLAPCLLLSRAKKEAFDALTPHFLEVPGNVPEKEGPLFLDTPLSVYLDTDIEFVLESDFNSFYRYTEKTIKAIAHGHPFLVWGPPGTLNVIRADGFNTFSPFINETYDTIQSDCARLHAVVLEVTRLLSLSNTSYTEALESMRAISEMNRNYLKGAAFIEKQRRHLKAIFEDSLAAPGLVLT